MGWCLGLYVDDNLMQLPLYCTSGMRTDAEGIPKAMPRKHQIYRLHLEGAQYWRANEDSPPYVVLEFTKYRWDQKFKEEDPPGEYTPLWNVVALGDTTVRCAAMRIGPCADDGKCVLTNPLANPGRDGSSFEADEDGIVKTIVYEPLKAFTTSEGVPTKVLVVVHPEDTAAAAAAIHKMNIYRD
jgi:hypothetical protein